MLRRFFAVLCAFSLGLASGPVFAQSGNVSSPEQQKQAGEAVKEGQKSIDEIAEVARSGKPTIYARFGDGLAMLLVAAALIIVLRRRISDRAQRHPP